MDAGKGFLAKIKKSQNKWIDYMNTTSDVYAFQIEKGTKAYEAEINECISDMTKKRIKEISTMIDNI